MSTNRNEKNRDWHLKFGGSLLLSSVTNSQITTTTIYRDYTKLVKFFTINDIRFR